MSANIRIEPFRQVTRYTEPKFGILRTVEHQALPLETLIQTAERLLLNEALADADGSQALAATRLRISRRVINYRTMKLGVRPKDKRST